MWAVLLLLAPYVDPRGGFQMDLPPGWTISSDKLPDIILYAHKSTTGQTLVVSRLVGPYGDSPPTLDQIEEGLKAKSAEYRRVAARARRLGRRRVPALDLQFRVQRDGRPVPMAARFLFYKSYALWIMVDGRGAVAITRTFGPVDKR